MRYVNRAFESLDLYWCFILRKALEMYAFRLDEYIYTFSLYYELFTTFFFFYNRQRDRTIKKPLTTTRSDVSL